MIKINLTELCQMDDRKFLCAVIVTQYRGKWMFVRQKGKETWELPGGTHEINETITETAERELFEETGAKKFSLTPISISAVNIDGRQSYGLLFYSVCLYKALRVSVIVFIPRWVSFFNLVSVPSSSYS